VTVPGTRGIPLWIRVAGFLDITGGFSLTVTELNPRACNDGCSGAFVLASGANGPFTNRFASTDVPAIPCGNAPVRDAWFRYTAMSCGDVRFDTCSGTDFDTAIQVFDQSCSNLRALACDASSCGTGSSVTVTAAPGTTFYVRVGGEAPAPLGDFVLTVTELGGSGSFVSRPTGCGGLTLALTGTPNLGQRISFPLSPSSLTTNPFYVIGVVPIAVPLACPTSCALGTLPILTVTWPSHLAQVGFHADLPCDPALRGATVSVQGFEWGVICDPALPSNTLDVTIG
jgi:hypothetical protein